MMDVDKNQQSPIMFRSSNETKVDSQYLCQFTMLLMDTVEELTGRVSQIEFVCRQHFPDLQTLSQSIQNRILGLNKSEELERRNKEESLLSKINELQSERQQSQAQIKQLNASLEEAKEKLTNKEKLLNRYLLEKKELLDQVVQKVNESVKEKEIEEDLLQQIKLKDKKIEVELSRKKSLLEEYNRLKTNYKHLKSQYNFLTSKFGNEMPNFLNTDMMENEKRPSTDFEKKICNEDMKNDIQEATIHAFQHSKSKIDNPPQKGCVADFVTGPKTATDASISTKQGFISLKPPLNPKKEPSGCWKGSVSRWRDTRTRQELKVGDPHDDFLNTPIENAQNLLVETRKVKEDISPSNECMDADCSDDEETLDIKPEIVSRKHPISVAGPSKKPFKYVEPVRKKAERENLKGVECQQCKKFYDAVLPDGGKDAAKTARCEHQDCVSRHRYRYAPPLTPEGFWNIGFDSDL